MKPEQIEILKKKLDAQGLDPKQWESCLENANSTCFCLAAMIEETEPSATNDISALNAASDILFAFFSETDK